jgi:hypothetical protein
MLSRGFGRFSESLHIDRHPTPRAVTHDRTFQRLRSTTSNGGILVLSQKRRRHSPKATRIAGKADILGNAILEKGLHVVGNACTLSALHESFMLAAKIKATRCRVVEVETLAKASPAFGKMLGRSGKLEVINIDDEIQSKFDVKIARWPSILHDRSEPCLKDLGITVLLPVGARVRVTINGA